MPSVLFSHHFMENVNDYFNFIFPFSTRTQYSYKIKIKDSKPISNYLCPNGYSSLQPQLHDYETMIMKTTIEKGIRK